MTPSYLFIFLFFFRAVEEQKFILALAAEGENILHLGPLGEQLAEQVSSLQVKAVTITDKFKFSWVLMNVMLFWLLMKAGVAKQNQHGSNQLPAQVSNEWHVILVAGDAGLVEQCQQESYHLLA